MKFNIFPRYKSDDNRESEKGAALAIAIIVLLLIMAVSVGVLAIATSEMGISASDTRRTQTFYVAVASIEYVTNNFSDIFAKKNRPDQSDLDALETDKPADLEAEGFRIRQNIVEDADTLARLREAQKITDGITYPTITISPNDSLAGLFAVVTPYRVTSVATHLATGTRVTLERRMNSYSVPLFQYAIFGDKDVEIYPGPEFNVNGRVHSNRNLYLSGEVGLTFEDKVTSAEEIVYGTNATGIGGNGADSKVFIKSGSSTYRLTAGSVNNGPNFASTGTSGTRGYFPDSPNGTVNSNWGTSILEPSSGTTNRFGGQVLSRSTGATKLLLPLQLDNKSDSSPLRELIKRSLPGETQVVKDSRYVNKARVRILIDDEDITPGTNAAGISVGGVELSETVKTDPLYFDPIPLPITPVRTLEGRALYQPNTSAYTYGSTWLQQNSGGIPIKAHTVRGVKAGAAVSDGVGKIPSGAGIKGRIKIEIVDAAGGVRDVTREILSMGMTVGEPNAIVQLQRPLWAAFLPGSRTRGTAANADNLVNLIQNKTNVVADGELKLLDEALDFDSSYGNLTNVKDDDDPSPYNRADTPNPAEPYNKIVPINIYNVREGWEEYWPSPLNLIRRVTERGMTSVVEINMRNLTRWLDGYYDSNLLSGSQAVSSNIGTADGFIVYVSDRRGDKRKNEYVAYNSDGSPASSAVSTTNGTVDNEDIYSTDFASAIFNPGEDVIEYGINPENNLPYKGSFQTDLDELPSPTLSRTDLSGSGFPFAQPTASTFADRKVKAIEALRWLNQPNPTGGNYFRRSVRLFDAADLDPNFSVTSGTTPARLSTESGITIATENMVYIWGNYNTTNINAAPSQNNGAYIGNQIPASIVCDAVFPLSRTWFDGLSVLFPDSRDKRTADIGNPTNNYSGETAVRTAIIAGTPMTAKANSSGPGQTNGGVHNFPRFLEGWQGKRWNYTGSLMMLYYSNQAMGGHADTLLGNVYGAPLRNWSFDITFLNPKRLPPGTPLFQYTVPSAWRNVIDPNATPTP